MPKTKTVSKSSKSVAKNSNYLKLIVVALVAALVTAGAYFYTTMQKSSINQIVESSVGRPMPRPTPRECEIVKTFNATSNCGPNSFQTISFTCGKDTTVQKIGTNGRAQVCKTYTELYADAQAACTKMCPPPTPTPTPIPRPTVSPTCIPQPSCDPSQPCAFKLDARYCGVTKPTPTTTSIPSPQACRTETGFCVTSKSASGTTCTSYSDSCQKAKICLPAYINESCE